ncbi:Homeodomain-like protein [Nemania serpens]|nr:Homeodomain-like protein [Nemania serpens]
MQKNSNYNTGTWSAEEDDRLRSAIDRHGTRWVLVATDVVTRNGDQCAKRWNENLNPELDHSPWSPIEDKLLLHLVEVYGRNWKFLASNHLESRAPLALKNRHSLLMRRAKRGVTGKRTPTMMPSPQAFPNLPTPTPTGYPDEWTLQPDDPLLEQTDMATINTHNHCTSPLPRMGWENSGALPSFPQATLPSPPSSSATGIPTDTSTTFDCLFGAGGEQRRSYIDTSGVRDQSQVTDVSRNPEAVNYSVTCSRRNLRTLVCSIVDTALSEIAVGDDHSVTLSIRLQS